MNKHDVEITGTIGGFLEKIGQVFLSERLRITEISVSDHRREIVNKEPILIEKAVIALVQLRPLFSELLPNFILPFQLGDVHSLPWL